MIRFRSVRRAAWGLLILAGSVVLGGAGAAQTPQEQPTFRTEVDVIQLDVSVLDKDRRPVRGLTASDFTVLENGKPQRLVTVTAVDAADRDPSRSARMRYVSNDVAMNDLADALGDGRLFAIVFDDRYLPDDDTTIAVMTREAARHAIEQMGPSDIAAVIYSQESGKTQDFTSDREKLFAAIDRFDPKAPAWVGPTPRSNPAPEGDMQRFSTVLMRSQCAREEPSIPTLDAVVSRMASVPKRRKSLLFFSIGVPLNFGGRGCNLTLGDMMKDVFRKAQAANVNIHAIDPAGYNGYLDYLRTHPARRGREIGVPDRRRVPGNAQLSDYLRFLHEFLENAAESTGGRAVINTDAIQPAIERIFEEDGSFYLLGYQTSNGNPDGKYRKVEVTVDRPGLTVLTRSGYWAPTKDAVVNTRDNPTAGAARDLAMSGMDAGVGLALRANVVALGPPQTPGQPIEVAIALSIRLPPLRSAAQETLTLTRNVYDADGRAGPPDQETVKTHAAAWRWRRVAVRRPAEHLLTAGPLPGSLQRAQCRGRSHGHGLCRPRSAGLLASGAVGVKPRARQASGRWRGARRPACGARTTTTDHAARLPAVGADRRVCPRLPGRHGSARPGGCVSRNH